MSQNNSDNFEREYQDLQAELDRDRIVNVYNDKFIEAARLSETLRRKQESSANMMMYILILALALILVVFVHYLAGIVALAILIPLRIFATKDLKAGDYDYLTRKSFFEKYGSMIDKVARFSWK